jgi:hypothetical protein
MKCEEIVYLDSDFLSKKYEDEYAQTVMTSLVREEGLQGGIKIPFASGGAYTKEIKTYNLSVYGMYRNLRDNLEKYPTVRVFEQTTDNKVSWISGKLLVAHHKTTKGSGSSEQVLEDGFSFVIRKNETIRIILITKDEYFSSGYENLLNMLSPIYLSFETDVKCLLNMIGWNQTLAMAVAVPYVIHVIAENIPDKLDNFTS